MRRGSREVAEFLEWLRRQGGVSDGGRLAFDQILGLVEYVASREDLVHAPERELEPDALARRFMSDAEDLAITSVGSILEDFSARDLERVEHVLLALERTHGRILGNPASHRLLLDAAILGNVGYVYSRKFREVLTTHMLARAVRSRSVLAELTAGVDRLFSGAARPYRWRLGPEFGTDRNIVHLLERGDEFIVRGLYPTRARRLAREVTFWQACGDVEIGEYCDPLYPYPARNLVLRWRNGRTWSHGLLVTNLFNTPWQRILQLHRNRACKFASVIDLGEVGRWTRPRKVAASLLILALFAFRNVRSWAIPGAVGTVGRGAAHGGAAPGAMPPQVARGSTYMVERINASRRAMIFANMGTVIRHLREMGEVVELGDVTASLEPTGYIVPTREGTIIKSPAAGVVIFVDAPGDQEAGRTVVIYHQADGFATIHSFLDAVDDNMLVGGTVRQGEPLGRAAAFVQFAAVMNYEHMAGGAAPSAAGMLSATATAVLDPLGKLAEGTVDAADPFEAGYIEGSGTLGPTGLRNMLYAHTDVTAVDDTGNVEVIRLEGPDLGTPLAFLSAQLDAWVAFQVEEIIASQDIDSLDLPGVGDVS